MTVINMTQNFLKSGKATLAERLRFWCDFDMYSADSLSEGLDYFRKFPPIKHPHLDGLNAAYLILKDCEIRRTFGDFSDNRAPHFHVKDPSLVAPAVWGENSSHHYKKAKKVYTLNEGEYVQIPYLLLSYYCGEKQEWLFIRNFWKSLNIK